jgi:hypothetical protein
MKKFLTLAVLWAAALCVSPAHAQMDAANTTAQLFPAAAQTQTSLVSNDQQNASWRGVHVVVVVSSYTSGTYTPHIQGEDPYGNYYDILVGPAISATGTTVLKVYPGIATLANGAASDLLPTVWRVTLVGASTPSMTISVGANLER